LRVNSDPPTIVAAPTAVLRMKSLRLIIEIKSPFEIKQKATAFRRGALQRGTSPVNKAENRN